MMGFDRHELIADNFRFRISNTGAGSDKFGCCEICGRRADTIYIQSYGIRYRIETDNAKHEGWSHFGNKFGHRECLVTHRNDTQKLRSWADVAIGAQR